MSEIDIKRLRVDESLWPDGAEYMSESGDFYKFFPVALKWFKWVDGEWIRHGYQLPPLSLRRPNKSVATKTEWVDGLPPDSIAEFRKALALNLQNSIEAITGEAFGDDDSLILAHEMMVKYDISDKLKYTGD